MTPNMSDEPDIEGSYHAVLQQYWRQRGKRPVA